MSNQQPAIEKKIIHINKSFGNVETNLNSKITYNLKDPLHLRRNDTVSLVKAMVGERGLSPDTIAFTEIQRITLKGFIYTQANSRKYGNFGSDKHPVQEFGYYPDTDIAGIFNDIEKYGPTNEPIFLVRIIPQLKSGGDVGDPNDYNYWVMPETVEKTVVINPGNYTVSALAQEFEIQLTGQQDESDTFQNFLLQQQNLNNGFGGNFFDNKWLLGKEAYKSIFPKPEFPSTQPNYQNFGSFLCQFLDSSSSPGEGYCFLDGKSFKTVVEDGRNGTLNDINTLTGNIPPTKNGYAYYGLSQGAVSVANQSEQNPERSNTMKYNIYGASEFQLMYDTETVNRFSIANLHTPLKVPNYTDFNTTNPNAGQQITKFDARDRDGDPDNTQKGFYPLETSSGFIGLSFDYEAIKKTDIYIDNDTVLTEDINDIIQDVNKIKSYFTIYTYRHFEYYPNDTVPDETFEGSFWDRLGFDIKQLYNFNDNIEQYYRLSPTDLTTLDIYTMFGIITHNDSGYTMATSAGGMGQPILTNDGTPFQPYSTFGILTTPPQVPRPNTEFNILTTSKFLTAEKYPDLLAGKNYYIIKSNIVQNNYYDVKSNKSSIIGLINFNFVSNDTIFSTEGIEFPITQDTILNEITMELTNPDGSPVSEQILSKNSGFLVQIVRNLNIDLEIQQLENKPQKKE